MVGFRKIAVWLVLASYLFAGTLSASWHDHQGHAGCPCAAKEHGHDYIHDAHGGGLHHHHAGDHHDHNQSTDESPCAPHHCVVCEFLAIAPLPSAVPELIAAGESVPTAVVQPVFRLSEAPIQAHPARGPPVAG
ncbi:MAG: hypothetical protein HY290_09625 [Planctomycetia bacterium]|nr:hypothetical protein [Planctomycetia bacterium]